jgi:hypothetical protein
VKKGSIVLVLLVRFLSRDTFVSLQLLMCDQRTNYSSSQHEGDIINRESALALCSALNGEKSRKKQKKNTNHL